MHDPMTVAHEIKYPWYKHQPWPKKSRRDPDSWRLKREWEQLPDSVKARRNRHWPEGYRDTFLTIWHIDPQHDGSDDSCGYSYPKLTPQQRDVLKNTAWWEGQYIHFLCCPQKKWDAPIIEAEFMYRGLVLLVSRVLKIKITLEEVSRYAAEATHIRSGGYAGDTFCFLPGYHTNSEKDTTEARADHFHGILCGVARGLLRSKRRSWQHPKWHVWHWSFQCHPLGAFKRWAFSRCCKCGKRFKWGYNNVIGYSWNGTGPLWFRSEKQVAHGECDGSSTAVSEAPKPPASQAIPPQQP